MNRKALRSVLIAGGLIALLVLLAPLAWHHLLLWGVGLHQRSVTHSLAAWEQELQQIRDLRDAEHAIDMLEYVGRYYNVADGYRSDAATETALEHQRAKTLATIVAALSEFSGLNFGTDALRWREWLAEQEQTHSTTK